MLTELRVRDFAIIESLVTYDVPDILVAAAVANVGVMRSSWLDGVFDAAELRFVADDDFGVRLGFGGVSAVDVRESVR